MDARISVGTPFPSTGVMRHRPGKNESTLTFIHMPNHLRIRIRMRMRMRMRTREDESAENKNYRKYFKNNKIQY
jgi:hypothetical protein